jgi:hypothetical protein
MLQTMNEYGQHLLSKGTPCKDKGESGISGRTEITFYFPAIRVYHNHVICLQQSIAYSRRFDNYQPIPGSGHWHFPRYGSPGHAGPDHICLVNFFFQFIEHIFSIIPLFLLILQ